MFHWLRKRRCGTCRYYKPSPLKGRGWCQHPKVCPDNGFRLLLVSARRLGCGHRPSVLWVAAGEEKDTRGDPEGNVMAPKRVPGAPFQVGNRVRVVKIIDDTGGHGTIGMVGTVVGLEYESGSGQSYPDRPLLEVAFRAPSGVTCWYWPEELESVTGD